MKTTSSVVTITVNNLPAAVNQPPVITIVNPGDGSTFTAPAAISITANADDTDGSISKVEFFNGTVKVGEKTSSPWSIGWNNVAAGNYSLTALATDNLNAKTTSSSVSITVNDLPPVVNQSPVVSIINPVNGQTYAKYGDIIIDAFASDPDGTISKVEFYNGNTLLAEINNYPYSYTWKFVDKGFYTITAVVTDNLNATSVSSPVWVEVKGESQNGVNSEVFNLYPNPNNGHFTVDLIEPMQSANRKITILAWDGKSIHEEPWESNEISKQFDLPDMKAGTYILVISDAQIILTKEFVKQ